jgi:hypothetical protein
MAFEREIGLAVAAGAVAAYPPARDVARKGAAIVVDTAGRAGNVVVGAGKGAYQGARAGFTANGSSSRGGRTRATRASGPRRSAAPRRSRSSSSRSRTSRSSAAKSGS